MKTVKIPLAPLDALRLLRSIEEPWQLLGLAEMPGIPFDVPLPLVVHADGIETVHRVTLHPNGTWTATTRINA